MLRYAVLTLGCVAMMPADSLVTITDTTTGQTVCSDASECSVLGHGSASVSAGPTGASLFIIYSVFPHPSDEYSVTASATFSDQITYYGGTGQGYLQFSAVGDYTTVGCSGAYHATFDGQRYGHGPAISAIPFTFGQPFTLTSAVSGSGSLDPQCASADAESLVQVNFFGVLDSNGNQLTGLSYASADGLAYLPGEAVPEPATALLIGPVVGLWWWRKQRRKL